VEKQVDGFFERDATGEFIDVVPAVEQYAFLSAHVSDPGFSGDDSFESFGDDGHGGIVWWFG
jgi:hypothetical protein